MTIDKPWAVTPAPTDAQIRTDEDILLKAQIADVAKRIAGDDGETTAPPVPEPVSADPAAELAAFVELLAHLAASDDGDAETVVTAITADAFAEETFTPDSEESPS